jgi:ribonuclease HII
VSAPAAPRPGAPRPRRLTLGIDEAGRGPALGPMVVGAVALDAAGVRALRRHGVRDSKAYGSTAAARATRAALVPVITAAARYAAVRVVPVATIDQAVRRGHLNRLERTEARALIAAAPVCARVVCDGARVFGPLGAEVPHLHAVDHGEEAHVAVAAASVLAKARRDELFAAIAARYAADFGPLTGGGYCNAATRAFLRAYAARHRALPPEARRSWPYDYLADLLPPEAAEPAPGDQLSLL